MDKIEKKTAIAIVVPVLLAFLFCGLWLTGRQDGVNFKMVCLASADNCMTEIEDFKANGNEDSYWRAVAEFRVFGQTYIAHIGRYSGDYSWFTDIYAFLTADPDLGKANIDKLDAAMKELSVTISSEKGFTLLEELLETFKAAYEE